MNGEKSGEYRSFLFSDAPWISARVSDHSRQMKTQICTFGDVGVRRRWISLITNSLNCWAPVPLSQINMALLFLVHFPFPATFIIGKIGLLRISDISAKSGMVRKSKIPDRLGFFRRWKDPTSGLMQVLHFNWLHYLRTIGNSSRVAKFRGFSVVLFSNISSTCICYFIIAFSVVSWAIDP